VSTAYGVRKSSLGFPPRPTVSSPSGWLIAGGVLLFVLLAVLALALWLAPPLVLGLLVFPALGLTGWATFWATVVAFLVWWVILGAFSRK